MIEIRPADRADIESIRSIVEAAYEPYVERMGKKPAPMLDDYDALVARGAVTVARAGEDIAGVIVMWPKSDHLYVDNVAVDPAQQGSGLGARLLAEADNAARASGLDEIRLYTNEAMTENLDYDPARGFVETHRAVEAGYRRIYFSKSLRP